MAQLRHNAVEATPVDIAVLCRNSSSRSMPRLHELREWVCRSLHEIVALLYIVRCRSS
jgi:hypothetical protein